MSDCGLWVLGDVSKEEIEQAKAALPPGAKLLSISDEGTIGYSPEPTWRRGRGPIIQPERKNWLKGALRG